MKVSAVTLNTQQQNQKPAFKSVYATLSKPNLGVDIAKNVVDVFNVKILPDIKKTQANEIKKLVDIKDARNVVNDIKDFQENVNFFVLAGGAGSRFKELAQTVGNYNKISTPFRVDENTDVHMLDFAMAMSKHFIGDKVISKVSETPMGSFGDIVSHYTKGNPIKDTLICCGDNVFGDSSIDIMKFMVNSINNPNKHLALIGVERQPEEVAERFGVLKVGRTANKDIFTLDGFEEKPKLEDAVKIAIDGKNIANTGLFYISKDSIAKIMDELKNGINNIKKNDTEPYDFAQAVKYVHSKTNDWFGINSSQASDVKIVKKWEDVGEPKALYSFANEVKQGTFLANFPKKLAEKIQSAFVDRVHLECNVPHILFTKSTDVSKETINNAKVVDGVHIVV